MHIILSGATGLVGNAALSALLANPAITKVSLLTRRPVAQAEGHDKVNVILHKDYESYGPDLAEQLKDASGCIWAQGISQRQVNKEEYIKITKTYPLAFARFLETLPEPSPKTFVLVSGEGATHEPGRFTPLFGRVKGEAEQELLALASNNPSKLAVYVGRPAGVDATAHPEIQPFIPGYTGVAGLAKRGLIGTASVVYKDMLSPTKELGQALVELVQMKGENLKGEGVVQGKIATNVHLRRMENL